MSQNVVVYVMIYYDFLYLWYCIESWFLLFRNKNIPVFFFSSVGKKIISLQAVYRAHVMKVTNPKQENETVVLHNKSFLVNLSDANGYRRGRAAGNPLLMVGDGSMDLQKQVFYNHFNQRYIFQNKLNYFLSIK